MTVIFSISIRVLVVHWEPSLSETNECILTFQDGKKEVEASKKHGLVVNNSLLPYWWRTLLANPDLFLDYVRVRKSRLSQ